MNTKLQKENRNLIHLMGKLNVELVNIVHTANCLEGKLEILKEENECLKSKLNLTDEEVQSIIYSSKLLINLNGVSGAMFPTLGMPKF